MRPFPPCGGRLGWGAPPHDSKCRARALGNTVRVGRKIAGRNSRRWCRGTPHPAPPKLTTFAKASHPSPTRGEEVHLFPCLVELRELRAHDLAVACQRVAGIDEPRPASRGRFAVRRAFALAEPGLALAPALPAVERLERD